MHPMHFHKNSYRTPFIYKFDHHSSNSSRTIRKIPSLTMDIGQMEIVNMIKKMADLESDEEFDFTSTEALDRLLQCATHALPYFSKNNKSTLFLDFIVMKVLPHYYELPDMSGVDVKDQLCKLAAELAVNVDTIPDANTLIQPHPLERSAHNDSGRT